jgi:DNA polymerase-3 subunit alpha
VQPEMIQFFEQNLKAYPGSSSVRFNLVEPRESIKACLFSNGHGFEMNHEMIEFLEQTPEIDVQVVTA